MAALQGHEQADVPQALYAEDDSPQLSEDDDADGAAANEDDGEEYMARAALGLRTKPRKVLPQVLECNGSVIVASMTKFRLGRAKWCVL